MLQFYFVDVYVVIGVETKWKKSTKQIKERRKQF